jgi:hypothetical protein
MNRHGEGAYVILLDAVAQLQVLRIFFVKKAGTAPDHEYLPDFFFEGELAQGLLCPLFSAVRKVDRAGALIFFFGEGRCGQQERNDQES